MSDFDYGDHGHETGHEGGYDAGHEQYDLNHLHADQGHEHDQFTHLNQYAENHAHESDEHYAHFNHTEAGDGHGAYYSSTDATELDAHEASADSVSAENYTNAEHDQSHAELDQLRERLESDYLHHGPELGEGGHEQLTAR